MTLPPFPFDVTTTIPEFLSWKMGVFSEKITEGRVYLRARIPSLHPTTDDTNSRLVLSPHVDDEDVKELRRMRFLAQRAEQFAIRWRNPIEVAVNCCSISRSLLFIAASPTVLSRIDNNHASCQVFASNSVLSAEL